LEGEAGVRYRAIDEGGNVGSMDEGSSSTTDAF